MAKQKNEWQDHIAAVQFERDRIVAETEAARAELTEAEAAYEKWMEPQRRLEQARHTLHFVLKRTPKTLNWLRDNSPETIRELRLDLEHEYTRAKGAEMSADDHAIRQRNHTRWLEIGRLILSFDADVLLSADPETAAQHFRTMHRIPERPKRKLPGGDPMMPVTMVVGAM